MYWRLQLLTLERSRVVSPTRLFAWSQPTTIGHRTIVRAKTKQPNSTANKHLSTNKKQDDRQDEGGGFIGGDYMHTRQKGAKKVSRTEQTNLPVAHSGNSASGISHPGPNR